MSFGVYPRAATIWIIWRQFSWRTAAAVNAAARLLPTIGKLVTSLAMAYCRRPIIEIRRAPFALFLAESCHLACAALNAHIELDMISHRNARE